MENNENQMQIELIIKKIKKNTKKLIVDET